MTGRSRNRRHMQKKSELSGRSTGELRSNLSTTNLRNSSGLCEILAIMLHPSMDQLAHPLCELFTHAIRVGRVLCDLELQV